MASSKPPKWAQAAGVSVKQVGVVERVWTEPTTVGGTHTHTYAHSHIVVKTLHVL